MSNVSIESVITIEGMTCVSCQNRIEKKLKETQGITNVKVSYSTGKANLTYEENIIDLDKITKIIESLDYKVANSSEKVANKSNGTQILAVVIILFSVYTIINHMGGLNIFNFFPVAEEGMGYTMLFGIGLLTSLHCVAMCGGINLSQCVPQKTVENVKTGKFASLRPSILYNLGRVISYTVVGGIVGGLGSVISFSGEAKGLVQLIAGAFMVIMGLNMLNLFPWLRRLNPRMPKIFARKINQQKIKNRNSSLYVGLLNGLMPCGPLQAMQIYALSTGSPIKGALSMLLFSLGTVPLMFGLGALSSILSKKFTHKMTSASAVLVVFLGIFMFNSGIGLSGIALPTISSYAGNSSVAQIVDGVQIVTTQLSSGRYEPITVQKGIPVRWTIQAPEGSINGCNNSIIIPKYDKEFKLAVGDNIIEFTPTESGSVPFSCWMGMIRSRITVVDDINKADVTDSSTSVNYRIPTDEVAVAQIKDNKQYVEITMDDKRFTPAVIVVQSGLETEIVINASKISGSNSTLIFPIYYAQIDMKEGENPIYLIPEVDFDFSTIDNSFSAYVKVVSDIKDVNLKAIKDEVKDYVPTTQDIDSDNAGLPSCH
ncbi:MAG: heavy metal transporter [Clostridiales bacterium]|jgi:sulfite exporter TauE/SafE/copper chaperone CopZ/plastocyanin domain-containing protein|nr:heavy metal transporter [Clostridiales bacterium]